MVAGLSKVGDSMTYQIYSAVCVWEVICVQTDLVYQGIKHVLNLSVLLRCCFKVRGAFGLGVLSGFCFGDLTPRFVRLVTHYNAHNVGCCIGIQLVQPGR